MEGKRLDYGIIGGLNFSGKRVFVNTIAIRIMRALYALPHLSKKSIVGAGALICLASDELGHLFSHLSSEDQQLLFLSRIYFCLRLSKGLRAPWFAAVVF